VISPWATILISLSSAIVAALLTPFATARWLHRNWQRQRVADLRFTTVAEVKRLVAEFQASYLFKDMINNTSERAFTFGQSWITVSNDVKDLFTDSTYQAFDKMSIHIKTAPLFSTQEATDRVSRIVEFEEPHRIAMQALYKESGIL
jgi:hypothetical protein